MRIVQGIDQFLRILLFNQERVVPRNHAPVRTLYGTHKFTGSLLTNFEYSRELVRIVQGIDQFLRILLFHQLSTVPRNYVSTNLFFAPSTCTLGKYMYSLKFPCGFMRLVQGIVHFVVLIRLPRNYEPARSLCRLHWFLGLPDTNDWSTFPQSNAHRSRYCSIR